MANLLTAIRLLLVIPVTIAIADAEFLSTSLLLSLIAIAIASDYFDGKVARALNTASNRGQLFDHGTDFLFVTSGLSALSITGHINPALPILIAVAFSQYILDSYYLFKQKHLRMSFLGRWNGVFYFVPLVLTAIFRLSLFSNHQLLLNTIIEIIAYLLIVSTLASIVDRSMAPLRKQQQ